jgi:long-chain acyl-CoA synthetase
VSSGTAPLAPSLAAAFEARFGVPVLQTYGQTEAFGAIAIENVREVLAGSRRPGSVGRPLAAVDVRIVADGDEVATGVDGEIVVRSRASTRGYVGDTAEDDASPVDADGWLHTGDLGHFDDDGYLFVTGRLRSIVICGGFNVVPEEVEAALVADPRVVDATVVGLPDERLGEIPVAVVEGAASPESIADAVAPRLAPYKRPRGVYVVDALPRLANGKVDRVAVERLARTLRTR